MKKTTQKLLAALFCAFIIATPLASCGSAADNGQTSRTEPPSSASQNAETSTGAGNSTSSTENGAVNDITADTYKEQISYYMTLTESLQAELLKLKEENYIEECEYQLQISALEETVASLKKTVAALSGGDSTVNSGSHSNDSLSARSDYKYTVKDGKVTVTAYTGNGMDVTIPQSIDGFPVVAIGEEAFKGAQIRSVIIPSSVKEIGWFAFASCAVLESVSIPSSVISVGYGAFDYCPKSLKIICEKDSYAETYASSWGFATSAK